MHIASIAWKARAWMKYRRCCGSTMRVINQSSASALRTQINGARPIRWRGPLRDNRGHARLQRCVRDVRVMDTEQRCLRPKPIILDCGGPDDKAADPPQFRACVVLTPDRRRRSATRAACASASDMTMRSCCQRRIAHCDPRPLLPTTAIANFIANAATCSRPSRCRSSSTRSPAFRSV